MGAVCCGEKKGHTGVLDKNHLQHNLVSSKTKDFHDVYEIVELIGEGSISRISKVRKKGEKDGTMYALKEIELSLVKKEYIDELINEIELLKGIDHPDIIKAYETFKLKNRMAIVMELLTGGDLYARQPYSERDTSIIVFQILTAVAYLHSRNIVHRDLKHENIMFASKHTSYIDVKVIDFGLAKKYMYNAERLHERVGTLYTMAPEVMSGDYSGSACDLWSIGVITYMLLSNKKPFWGASPKETIAQVRKGEVKFEGRSWKNISDAAKDFILKLLKKIPSERLTAKKALAHPFIRDRTKLSTEIPDPELLDKIKGNIVRYADSSDFKKIALQVIARRSTSEEIFELRNLFIEADKSQDGTLSLSEFKDALSQLNYSADEIESIFSKIDVNQTGNILYTEFLAATLEARGNIDMHKMAEAFQQLDVTETGYIEKADLQKLLPKNIKEEEMEKLIADVDADGDGRISFQEFTKAFTDETHSKISQLYTDKKTSAP